MKHDKRFAAVLAGALLAILCCALPALVPAAVGAALFAGLGGPWVIGTAAFLVVLLLAGKLWRTRTRQAGCGCGPSCMSTERGDD